MLESEKEDTSGELYNHKSNKRKFVGQMIEFIFSPLREIVEQVLNPTPNKKQRIGKQISTQTDYPNIHALMNQTENKHPLERKNSKDYEEDLSQHLQQVAVNPKDKISERPNLLEIFEKEEGKNSLGIYLSQQTILRRKQAVASNSNSSNITLNESMEYLSPSLSISTSFSSSTPLKSSVSPSLNNSSLSVDIDYEETRKASMEKLDKEEEKTKKRIETIKNKLLDSSINKNTFTQPSAVLNRYSIAPIDLTYDDERYDNSYLFQKSPFTKRSTIVDLEKEELTLTEIQKQKEKLKMLAKQYKLIQKQAAERSKKKKVKYPELTEEQLDIIENALNGGEEEEVLSEAFNLKVTRADILRLQESEWLNDEVINFYINIIMERNKRDKSYPKVFIFNTFFYPLLKQGYQRVRRWAKKYNIDIFELDKVIVPVHMNDNHWCLAVINFMDKRFEYYDSLGGENYQALKYLKLYVEEEHKDKKGNTFDVSNWQDFHPKDIPKQMNGSDCGVFMCKYADFISKNAPFTFDQENMPYFRKRMILDIILQSHSY